MSEDIRVSRLLGLEVEIERSWSVAGRCRDRPQRCAIQAFRFEYVAGGVQDQVALQIADRLAPAGSLIPCHDHSVARLTFISTPLDFNGVRNIDPPKEL